MEEKWKTRNKMLIMALVLLSAIGFSQTENKPKVLDKVKHIEPLFIDLVRDLGARKGEKEINVAGDFTNVKHGYSEYGLLAEYEFAPLNRLGLEIETDFIFYRRTTSEIAIPENSLENLRLSAQYSFYVSTKYNTTLALGYTQVFDFTDFKSYDDSQFVTGLVYSPFFVAAKRWGNNFHTLLLTGPLFRHDFHTDFTDVDWQINLSFFYSIPNSSHFVGIEFNKQLENGHLDMVMRPQAKLQINHDLAIGFVAGFPLTKSENGFSSFFRVIYEL